MKLKSSLHWLANPLYLFLGLASLVPFVVVLIYVASYRLAVPFGDEWFMNGRVAIATAEKHLTLLDLFFVNAGHRTVFTNLVTAISTALDHWDLRPLGFVSPILTLFCFILLVRMFRKSERGGLLIVLMPFSLILFSLFRDYNWWSARDSHWYFANFFTLLALYVLSRERISGFQLGLASALGWCATFSMATGMVVWPLGLLLLLFQGKRDWRLYLGWILFGAVSVILYFVNSGIFSFVSAADVYANNGAQRLSVLSPSISNVAVFLLIFLGAGILAANTVVDVIIAVGIISLILFAVNAYVLWRSDRSLKRIAPWLVIGGFSIGAGILTGIGRAGSLGLERALSVQYIAGSEFFWVALIALMVMTIRSAWKSIPLQIIRSINVLVSVVCLCFFCYSSINALQNQARLWEHDVRLTSPETRMPDEQCALDFVYTRTTDCFTRIMLGLPSNTRALDRLAAANLMIFSEVPTVSLLPNLYQAGSPVVLTSSNIWTNVHVRDRLLNTVTESQIFHVVADASYMDEVSQILNPPIRISVAPSQPLSEFTSLLSNADQIWMVQVSDGTTLTSSYVKLLQEKGYTSVYSADVTEPIKLTLTAYQRLSPQPQPQFRFGDHFTLDGWTLGNSVDVARCEAISLQSIWSTDRTAATDYSMTAVIAGSDGVGVARSDGAPASLRTTFWKSGQMYMDRRQITIPCDLPTGAYNLLIGLYDYGTEASLSATTADGSPVSNLVYLTTLHVR